MVQSDALSRRADHIPEEDTDNGDMTLLPVMVSVRSPGGEIHNLRLDSGGVSSKGLGFSPCRGLPMCSCLENLLASR